MEVDRYDAAEAAKVAEAVRATASLEPALDRIERMSREVIDAWPAQRPTPRRGKRA